MPKALGFVFVFLLYTCGSSDSSSVDRDTRIKIDQYVAQGRKIYKNTCANCHQDSGKGLGMLYPPLENSDFLIQKIDNSICIVKYGMKGEILVNGKKYNQPMPANPGLSDLEIAEVITYVLNEFNDSTILITQTFVKNSLKSCE